MALRQLTEADCGQYNPLVQLTTHLTRDHALAENYGSTVFPSSSDQLVEQFLEETRVAPQTFRMDDLMREMHEIESQRALVPPVPASTVKDHLNDSIWAVEYAKQAEENMFRETNHDHIIAAHEAVWAEITARERDQTQAEANHLWHEEYEQEVVANNELQQAANELVDETSDSKMAYSKFLQFIKQVKDENGAITDDDLAQNWSEEYLDVTANEMERTFNKTWTSEQATTSDDASTSTFWNKLQDEWLKLAEQDSGEDHPWISEFNDYYDPYKEYEFNEENPMQNIPGPLEKGKELLERGDLPGAVLCFEAAARQDPNCVEAWQLLGITQAENEQDPHAICALKKCLELEPGNLKVLMALAVSYTNESYHHQACQSLVSWLKHHPEYADILPPNFQLSGQVTSLLNLEQHKLVQDLFIKAAQRQPINPDYEVQCGLGVLFNLSGEYDKAVDCFRAALNVKPDDSRLWNRLGATLANGNRSEEAVDAYHRALNLTPGFIRARYNVGITCINLGAYKEAAEHFLMALNQQARGGDAETSKFQMSETIWATLRMCISLMNRTDLRSAIEGRDLQALNNAFNIQED
ncbi:hypothetical protein ILUMI_23049 [Ignelater luminosus]|uniref:Peroxisomal targeting signal 1 receptor n=1 Tax=Ignelater luminosus TaxID=2038154 RepID=A0A8K0CFE5_IGNLU|nr:hypothetical protein ILUMI_23049 [Ignelater luminosus]